MRRPPHRLRRAIAALATFAVPGAAIPATMPAQRTAASSQPLTALDADAVTRRYFGNDAEWYRDRIPLFESADPLLDRVYYYRWQIVRAHQRDLGARGFITTEFLNDVGWQKEPYASLNDATGFHLGELRWLRDRRFAADYVDYMYTGGNDRHFSDYMADAVWSRYLVDGDRGEALRHLGAMRLLFEQWDDRLDRDKGLYWVQPLLDATEYTIASIDASGGKDGFTGGDAFRPSINAYMFANARAVARLSGLAGDAATASDYDARAAAIKTLTQRDLWSAPLGHFVDRYKVSNEYVRHWAPIRGRELVGYVPWAFDLPDDDPRYAGAWRHLLDKAGFAGPAGMRTVEPSYQYYMRQYRYLGSARECQWNGPIWPFQTTQVLQGMVNLLDHYHQNVVDRGDFLRSLRQYARLHLQGDRLDLEEDYDPATGKPIVGLDRSHHYFHSGFNDLVFTGLVGIRPRDDDVLEVNPLLPGARSPERLRWFRAERVPYHGHLVSVRWDMDGTHYRQGRGLSVTVDGKTVARRATLGRVTVPLARRAPPAIERPINRAAQLAAGGYPMPSASANTDPRALHAAVDGRTWFFANVPEGWTAPAGASSWFAIDFGKPVPLSRAELAFAADGKAVGAPAAVRIQQWSDGDWRDLAVGATPVANGVTHLRWAPVTTGKVRIVMTHAAGAGVRLVEAKAF